MNPIKTFIFFLNLICLDALATVKTVILLQNWSGNRIFLFPDIHLDLPDGNKSTKQQADLLSHAKKLNAHVIAEDMCNYTGDNKELKKIVKDYSNQWQELCFGSVFRVQPQQIIENRHLYSDFFLSNMLRKCEYKGLSYFNAECRQASSMAERCKQITGTLVCDEFWASEKKIRLKLEEMKGKPEQLLAYQWGIEKLNSVINNLLPLMNFLKSDSKSYSECVRDNIITLSEDLKYNQLYDSELVDINIIANVCNNIHKKTIFICAGAWHISNILPVLGELGFINDILLNGDSIPKEETNLVELIKSAPDIGDYFDAYYEYAQICPICCLQVNEKLEFIQHKIQCLERKKNKKLLLWGTAFIAAGIVIYKSLY